MEGPEAEATVDTFCFTAQDAKAQSHEVMSGLGNIH